MESQPETKTHPITDKKQTVRLQAVRPHTTRKARCRVETSTIGKGSDISLDVIHAGNRLVGTYELLELCLLELPNADVLIAQSVSKQFNSVISTSRRLQEKLFFTPQSPFGFAFRAKLNPIIMREDVKMAIPLFFDHEERRLACSFQDGFTRLYCSSMIVTTVFVYLTLSDEQPPGQLSWDSRGSKDRQLAFKTGSWRRMYLSQPSCFVSWQVTLTRPVGQPGSHDAQQSVQETYSGVVKGERTTDSLLKGLADSLVVKGR